MFALPKSLAIASFSNACPLMVGARPAMPTIMLAFDTLIYLLSKFMVPSFSGSGSVMGEKSPRDGEGRDCGLLLGAGSGEEGVRLPLFLLMGVGGGGRNSMGSTWVLDPLSAISFLGFRVPFFSPLFLAVEVLIVNLWGFKKGWVSLAGFFLSCLSRGGTYGG